MTRDPVVVFAAGLAALSGCATGKAVSKDVSITACTAGLATAHPRAEGRIVNTTSKPSLYAIQVAFSDAAGNAVTAGAATVGRVGAGSTATWRAEGATDAKGPVTCKVSGVTRTQAPSS